MCDYLIESWTWSLSYWLTKHLTTQALNNKYYALFFVLKQTTKVQLAKMCRKIAKTVSHIAVEILIPTLAQILELDSAGEASSSPSLTGSECANIGSIQEHVVKLNEDGLPKRPGSGRHYYSSHTPTPRSSTRYVHRPHFNCVPDLTDLSTVYILNSNQLFHTLHSIWHV